MSDFSNKDDTNQDDTNQEIIIDFHKCVDQLKTEAFVHSVYDGDSLKLIFPFQGVKYKWTCRMNGIDTPEIRSSDKNEKAFAYQVRDFVRAEILKKNINILCYCFDKYGRLLVDVYLDDGTCLNKLLVEQKFAFSYDGGKKQLWSDYFKHEITEW